LTLAFNKTLAALIAGKNGAGKNAMVLAVAMLLAFDTLVAHIYSRWISNETDSHEQ
jgi:predicted ATPase